MNDPYCTDPRHLSTKLVDGDYTRCGECNGRIHPDDRGRQPASIEQPPPSTAVVQCPMDGCTEQIGVEIELTLDMAGPRPPGSTKRDLSVHVKGLTEDGIAHVQAQHPELLVWVG